MSNQLLVPIQDLASATGVTSRTLRHYEAIGLLKPALSGSGGVRYYGASQMQRLQAILVMRELGLPLEQIRTALDKPEIVSEILETHLGLLEAKAKGISQMVAATRKTIENNMKGRATSMSEMFEGFNHTQYQNEVEEKWGKQAYADSDKWWRSMSVTERAEWKRTQDQLLEAWRNAATRGIDPRSVEAQSLAQRQENWLASIPGTPGYGSGSVPTAYLLGLADMYVADERFGANYGGPSGAEFVRETLGIWAAARGD